MKLEGKTVLITGAARGLGKAFAKAILEKGARVGGNVSFKIYLQLSIPGLNIHVFFSHLAIPRRCQM